MSNFRLNLFLSLFLFPSVSHAEYIAVLEIVGNSVDEDVRTVTSDSLRTGLHQNIDRGKYKLITRENLYMFLEDMGKEMSCAEGNCEVEIGRNIGADIIVSGSIAFFEEEDFFVLNTKMFSSESGTLIATFEENATSKIELMEDAKQIGIQMAQLLGEPLADIAIADFDSFDAILRDLNQEVWAPESQIHESIFDRLPEW